MRCYSTVQYRKREVKVTTPSSANTDLQGILAAIATTSMIEAQQPQCADKPLESPTHHSTAVFDILKLLLIVSVLIMGNICGKSEADPFAQPGRTLSSAPPPSSTKTSSVPKKVGGPPRTLGSSTSAAGAESSAQQEDARRKAAEAAEVSEVAFRSLHQRLATW